MTRIAALSAGLALAASLFAAAPADATTITFTAASNAFNLPIGLVHTEAGYSFSVTSGTEWGFVGIGNPGQALHAGSTTAIGIGDILTISRADGGDFTFDAFDYRSRSNLPSDGVMFQGLLDGSLLDTTGAVSSVTTAYVAGAGSTMTAVIDELRIVGVSQGQATLILDNLVFSEVAAPAPAAAALLPVALTGLALARRRRG